MNSDSREQTWLEKPETIRRLWWGFGIVLGLTVAAQLVVQIKSEVGIDGWFGFGAVYGFVSCLLMVVFAKLLGVFLKRGQDYYAESANEQEDAP